MAAVSCTSGAGLDAQDLGLLALLDPDGQDALERAQALDGLVGDAVDLDLGHAA